MDKPAKDSLLTEFSELLGVYLSELSQDSRSRENALSYLLDEHFVNHPGAVSWLDGRVHALRLARYGDPG